MWQKILWLGAAGALGAVARYGLSGLVQRIPLGEFPWGTLVVNLAGCFLFGFLWSMGEQRLQIPPTLRVVVFVGFLGAFTTFSTFAFETGQMIRDAQWGAAALNVFLQNTLGVVVLFLGMATGRAL